MRDSIHFLLDGRTVCLDFKPGSKWRPTTTVLQYLRSLPEHRGVKEGCAEGDCGACTVVLAEERPDGRLSYRAVDSCLMFLPCLDRKQLITIENLKNRDNTLHPVQSAMIREYGSQCGFCTPGVVMSLFALFKNRRPASRPDVIDALSGNLCRCTGYRPIVDAALSACARPDNDRFSTEEEAVLRQLRALADDDVLIESGNQQYLRPASLTSALTFRSTYPDALVTNGSTDIALRVTKKHETLPSILDLSGVAELQFCHRSTTGLEVGAGTTLQDVLTESAQQFSALEKMLRVFGSRQIRNIATIGGNVGTASPIGDTLPVLMALKSEVVLRNVQASRTMPVERFIKGYRQTDCRADELITSVRIPGIPEGTHVRSYKISRRHEMDISTVSAGFSVHLNGEGRVDDLVLAYGGMAATPARARKTEAFLHGKPWTRGVVEEGMKVIETEFHPLTDVRGSAEFRMMIARNVLLKFWDETTKAPVTAGDGLGVGA